MSKDSSIKVFAENASGTRPVNAIPVWIDNISAIGGGGEGGNPEVESYVQTNSATINDVNTSYQTNSANFIQYTASGVELTNSNFKIDTSGQAYKKVTENVEIVSNAPAGGNSEGVYFVPGTVFPKGTYKIITSYMGNRYVDLYHNGSRLTGFNIYGNLDDMKSSGSLVLNEQITASTGTHLWCEVQRFTNSVSAETVSTQDKEYALKSDIPNIPNSSVDLWNDTASTVQTYSASWSSAPNDTFYIYPGKTTDKEISENSGKDMKLYNSANNVFLDFAGKSTLSNYTMFSFKEITGTQGNQNTVQHLRLRVYPAATSACKVYDTTSVNLLDSNSTVNEASTAYYDGDGNSLTQTHSDLTALNQFIQSNSASWGQGGGGSDISPLGLWFGWLYSQPKAINNTNDTYSITLRNTQWEEPQSIYYDGNYYNWNGTNGDWYIDLTTLYPNYENGNLPYNSLNETKYTVIEFTNTNTQEKYSANLTIDGESYGRRVSVNNTACVISAVGEYAQFNLDYSDGMQTQLVSSWQGTNKYVSGSFTNQQATAFYLNVQSQASTAFIGFASTGSTVASGDVFPPTNNLDPYTTYYLGWNANNGGLQWFSQGGN